MPKIAVSDKGSAPDASSYTEFLKRKAILASQLSKSTTGDVPNVKPIIGREFLKQKGFESGIVEWKFKNGEIVGRFQ